MPDLSRREAVAAMTAIGAGALTVSASAGSGGGFLDADALGWNAEKGLYVLPPLPYAYDALEPHIDEATMRIHHDKHHAGYVRKLNAALVAMGGLRDGSIDKGLSDHWAHELSFNGGGHINHTLFWTGMSPTGGGEPGGDLGKAINADFGSFKAFADQFKSVAGSVKGSGWGWLAYEPMAGRLIVTHMHNQENGLFGGLVPLLGVDVWEHAYYLNYQNRRGDYLAGFMNTINWPEITRRFATAKG